MKIKTVMADYSKVSTSANTSHRAEPSQCLDRKNVHVTPSQMLPINGLELKMEPKGPIMPPMRVRVRLPDGTISPKPQLVKKTHTKSDQIDTFFGKKYSKDARDIVKGLIGKGSWSKTNAETMLYVAGTKSYQNLDKHTKKEFNQLVKKKPTSSGHLLHGIIRHPLFMKASPKNQAKLLQSLPSAHQEYVEQLKQHLDRTARMNGDIDRLANFLMEVCKNRVLNSNPLRTITHHAGKLGRLIYKKATEK